MLQILHGTNIPFMKYRKIAYFFSGAIFLATAVWFFAYGPKYSVDFTGGTLIQFSTTPSVSTDAVRSALDAAGFRGVEIQTAAGTAKSAGSSVSSDIMVRVKSDTTEARHVAEQMAAAIQQKVPGTKVDLLSNDHVGPKVGNELRQKAIWAILGSLGAILLYVGWRYEFKFALGGVVALLHDVIVTLGFLMFTGREVSLTIVAALLTIAGYSINDTIVVFDRIRERSKTLRKETHSRVMDIAVNETLSRTVITAFTVFLTALALFFWGGDVLHDFSFAMLVGTVFGTYSSVYVASAMALDIWIALDRRKGIQAE
jgi:preprotein translocase SecF subunit